MLFVQAELERRFAQIERQKAEILQIARDKNDAQRLARYKGNGFSINETVEHLVLAERQQVSEIERAQEEAATDKPAQRKLAYKAVLWFLRKKMRVPVPPTMVPRGAIEVADLEAEWAGLRAKLREALESVPPDRPNQTVSLHAMMGRLSGPQILAMTEAHLDYHLAQLREM